MLDQTTKKRIDNACDILVGKVPTPLAQVEQITLALIYKFMADMDKRSLSMGGQASYFSGDYEKYSWDNLMDTRIGAQERANLYEEGLNRLSTHSGLPELFRGIFKEASVPYRSSHTLNLFLKEIDGFSYEDSENLGDAYEYLLGKTGSQGEAGQFRTPRHIIDFIVQVVDPNKYDTILDPACGTAGFLISALKHIYRSNTKEIEGDLLSTQELVALSNNVFGYDITPDMVRISRVNMFLHNIKQPHIYEYDTLSSLERWDETYSCILANPPFMTPKGGVVPHNRFSIKSTRSEVLFVDYILEHLTLDGKAGIIVPEGIIFQSGNAYKQLRKKLVEENYLVGVISLPGGVFNPYSGVKTSILWIDRSLAKKTDMIIFMKVNNDGFDLGAQRRPINDSDLPGLIEITNNLKRYSLDRTQWAFVSEDVSFVDKDEILKHKDLSINAPNYYSYVEKSSHIDLVPLESAAEINPKTSTLMFDDISLVSFIPMADLDVKAYITSAKQTKEYQDVKKGYTVFQDNDVLLAKITPCFENGKIGIVRSLTNGKGYGSTEFHVVRARNGVRPEYIYYMISSQRFMKHAACQMTGSAGQKRVPAQVLAQFKIPLPNIAIQKEIVAELDSFRKIIDGAKLITDNWKPQIEIDPSWEKVRLGDLSSVVRGSSPRPKSDSRYYGGAIPRLMVGDLTRDGMYVTPRIDFLTEEGSRYSRQMAKGSLVMAVSGKPGLCAIVSTTCYIHDGFVGFRNMNMDKVDIRFAYYILTMMMQENSSKSVGAIFRNLKTNQVNDIRIPLPALSVQQAIVSDIENEQTIVESNIVLTRMYEQKIQEKVGKLWI